MRYRVAEATAWYSTPTASTCTSMRRKRSPVGNAWPVAFGSIVIRAVVGPVRSAAIDTAWRTIAAFLDASKTWLRCGFVPGLSVTRGMWQSAHERLAFEDDACSV